MRVAVDHPGVSVATEFHLSNQIELHSVASPDLLDHSTSVVVGASSQTKTQRVNCRRVLGVEADIPGTRLADLLELSEQAIISYCHSVIPHSAIAL